ncbi:MAG: ABC transporter ATP-binding protein [Chloroflexi bacterium]|nr:ABC transporter ATP-binding protein [Chloroflexota bacterium]
METTQRHDGVKLSVQEIGLAFGGVAALNDVSFDIHNGEILALIGPNGAGKTSLINSISGFYHPQRGEIRLKGASILGLPSHQIAQRGIARTFQNIELFTGMTTLDNLMAARHLFMKSNALTGALYFGPAHAEEIRQRAVVEEIIDLLEIEHIRKKVVGTLPYGLRKRVELGRALALEPDLLLLDEPMAGMNVEEKEDMARFILDIHEAKRTTILLVEHDMGVVMDISQRVVVLDFGVKIAEGTPAEIRGDARVVDAYLGKQKM